MFNLIYTFLLLWASVNVLGCKPSVPTKPTVLPACKHGLLIGEGEILWQSFTSPGFPNANYEDNLKCTWKIQGPAKHHILLKVQSMDTEINGDFVRIYGSGDESNLVSTLSGEAGGHEFEILGNEAFVTFETDGQNTGPGFKISYKAVAPTVSACSEMPQLFQGIEGSFVTPNYPDYSETDEVLCRWILTVPEGKAMVIMPIDIDGVRASWYDGRTNKSRTLFSDTIFYDRSGLFFDSTSNEVLFEIRPLYKKYRVYFRYFPISPRELDAFKLLTEPRGVITTPYYSGNYPGDSHMRWLISAPSSNRINLDPQSINLNGTDTITVYDGGSAEDSILKTFTGDEFFAPNLKSSGSEMLIVFESKKDSTDRGAYLEYKFVTDDCQGTIIKVNENEGYATSPPGRVGPDQPEYLTCTYNIRVASGKVVNYFFEEALDAGSLTLHDGSSTSSPLITNVVSTSTSGVTSSNELTMVVRVPQSSSKGFFMKYSDATRPLSCEGNLVKVGIGPSDFIQTPSYPMYYPSNLNFCWKIGFEGKGSTNTHMQLVFHPFNIAEGDHIVIYAGHSPTVENQIVSFTNTSNHYEMFRIPGLKATVQLITDGAESGRGFTMYYYDE